ncbi:MAG: L-threonylcarbamoyladenylate synthase [Solirubrobacterales bacterium]
MSSVSGGPGPPTLDADDARRFEECLVAGGVAIFPTDTVYGLACDPLRREAVARLYELKGRPPERPAAVMFFALQAALDALPELGERERAAMQALLPGPLTLLLPNRERRYPLACSPTTTTTTTTGEPVGDLPTDRSSAGMLAGEPVVLGLRVPRYPSALRRCVRFVVR